MFKIHLEYLEWAKSLHYSPRQISKRCFFLCSFKLHQLFKCSQHNLIFMSSSASHRVAQLQWVVQHTPWLHTLTHSCRVVVPVYVHSTHSRNATHLQSGTRTSCVPLPPSMRQQMDEKCKYHSTAWEKALQVGWVRVWGRDSIAFHVHPGIRHHRASPSSVESAIIGIISRAPSWNSLKSGTKKGLLLLRHVRSGFSEVFHVLWNGRSSDRDGELQPRATFAVPRFRRGPSERGSAMMSGEKKVGRFTLKWELGGFEIWV